MILYYFRRRVILTQIIIIYMKRSLDGIKIVQNPNKMEVEKPTRYLGPIVIQPKKTQ